MALKIAQAWRPDLGVSATLTIDSLYAMNLDSQLAGRPIHEPIDDNTRINSTFDAITYLKGGGVLAMFESYLGEDVFRRGIQQHLRAHQHGNADAQDFFRALADVAHQPAVVEAFRSFTDRFTNERRAALKPSPPPHMLLTGALAPGGELTVVDRSTRAAAASVRQAIDRVLRRQQ